MTAVRAEPYHWPWDGAFSTARAAVIVAGAQAFWAQRTVGAADVQENIGMLIESARRVSIPVVWIRHGRPLESRNSIPLIGSESWQLVMAPHALDVVVDAAGHDGCFGSRLDAVLRSLGREQLIVAGLGLEGPVHSTLRSLNDRGYECLTVVDAAAPMNESTRDAAISTIVLSFGIFGAVATAADVNSVLCQQETY